MLGMREMLKSERAQLNNTPVNADIRGGCYDDFVSERSERTTHA